MVLSTKACGYNAVVAGCGGGGCGRSAASLTGRDDGVPAKQRARTRARELPRPLRPPQLHARSLQRGQVSTSHGSQCIDEDKGRSFIDYYYLFTD